MRSANTTSAALADARFQRVIVLGMDGLDPNIVEEMIDAGQLPNFAAVMQLITCLGSAQARRAVRMPNWI